MLWKNEDGNWWNRTEKVQVYELTFSYESYEARQQRKQRENGRCIVVADTIEEAIAACRKTWSEGFVLHQAIKRNQGYHLIVCDSVLKTSV